MSTLQGIIFDFNGVLLLDAHLQVTAWNECARKLRGRAFSEEEMEHRVHGRTNVDTLTYLLDRPLDPNELAQLIDLKESIYQRLCEEHKSEYKLAPGSAEFLDYLKATHRPFTIATSSGISNLRFYFEHLPLKRWFDFDRIAYDDGTVAGKPAPDLFLQAAQKLGLYPQECIVLEDAHSGIAAAHQAGISKIIAVSPVHKHSQLARVAGVDQIIIGFGELLKNPDALWDL